MSAAQAYSAEQAALLKACWLSGQMEPQQAIAHGVWRCEPCDTTYFPPVAQCDYCGKAAP